MTPRQTFLIFACLICRLLFPLAAYADDRAHVHIIATGGTIASSSGGDPNEVIPASRVLSARTTLSERYELTEEKVFDVGSSRLTLENIVALSVRINRLFESDPALSGIVVTHGTDTLEETAFFLSLTIADDRPVIITGSMRPSDSLSADGPMNLRRAIETAAHEKARARGVLVVMNDMVFTAATAVKARTARTDAFVASNGGPVGAFLPDGRLRFFEDPPRNQARQLFSVTEGMKLPRVDIIFTYLDADAELINYSARSGAKGLVVACFGSGRLTPAMEAGVAKVVKKGAPVVLARKTSGGFTPAIYQNPDASMMGRIGVIPSGSLSPQKARILLMLALAHSKDDREIQDLFGSF